MPLVKWLEDSSFKIIGLILFGGILTALSLVVLNLTGWVGILIIGMLLMTVGEMISFPFSNAFAMQRAKRGKQGEYMALYSITFAISHIIGHNSGMQLIDKFGFEFTWNIMTIVMIISIFILVVLKKSLNKENGNIQPN
jgi:MFS family permease